MKAIKYRQTLFIIFIIYFFIIPAKVFSNNKVKSLNILKIGKPLPDVKLKAYGNVDIEINDLKGKIKIISIVPKLNTPVCDKQTHIFSETNGGLDKNIDIITLSTNTTEDQHQFSQKAKIHNLTFLSDSPGFIFGKKTGLLIDGLDVLRRTVIVADKNNIIRYIDFVPRGGLPNIKKAFEAAHDLWKVSRKKSK
jgi:thioredoxin-dependent peroxiredoxin